MSTISTCIQTFDFWPKRFFIEISIDFFTKSSYLPKFRSLTKKFDICPKFLIKCRPFFKKILIDFWSIFQENFDWFLVYFFDYRFLVDFSRKFRSIFSRFLSKISIFAINVSQIVHARVLVLFVYFYFRKIYFSKFQKNKYFQKKIQNIKNFFVDFSIVFFCSIYS